MLAGSLPFVSGFGCPGSGYDPELDIWPPRAPTQNPFVCERTIGWELPGQRENRTDLNRSSIKTLTIYAAQVPISEVTQLAFTMDVDPFLLMWEFDNLDPGPWYFRMTVTDKEGLESRMSNEENNLAC